MAPSTTHSISKVVAEKLVCNLFSCTVTLEVDSVHNGFTTCSCHDSFRL
ncbi:unnamed protein product [Chondrus crispus]|uniref:Uncharacterized protein n=1 Tax=Chondrus crispus TaxID=2769 RepID=R7QSI1_CHOCR|nr:unnamed protein product [Chondrus crispus]CDF41079.1 unnamed protein product [Chondrus crispus]|eukprot:XP_005711373.1 unnamed protein product [Chondrus crispus]